jgi:hypothetical protein
MRLMTLSDFDGLACDNLFEHFGLTDVQKWHRGQRSVHKGLWSVV